MVHLNVWSWFSFGAGPSSPLQLAQEAARRNQSALALTDRDTLAGALRHALACQSVGIRPLFGATLTVSGTPLVLLCADQAGYANLCDLITLSHWHAAQSGNRKNPHLALDELRGKTEGLFCLTGNRHGALARLIDSGNYPQARVVARHLAQLFPQRLFIELVHSEWEGDSKRLRDLIELASVLQIPTVATNAVRHATRGQYDLFDALTCVRLGLTVGQPHYERPKNSRAYLCGEKRLLKLGLPAESIANSEAIARECLVDLTPGFVTPPHTALPEGVDAVAYLKGLCVEGLQTRGLATSRAAKAQLKKEVEIICSLGLEEFFLVVREVVQFARSRGIRCAGRGSAANSLIAYLLGVTEVDPLRHHLLFERFLHEGRKGMPDVDIDFDSSRRDEVISWMNRRWGEEHTAMTANVVTYGLRSAIRELGKTLGYPLELLDRANKHLPHDGVRRAFEYRKELSHHLGDGVALDVLLGLCAGLHDGFEACPHYLGQHSGGMVLSRQPLRHFSPIQTSANGVRQLQFNKDDVEASGHIKFDVLGLRMLSAVSTSGTLLQSIAEPHTDIDHIPIDDPQTFELVRSTKTVGVFQIESPGQWNLLARSQPENFDDLVIQVALFRPGPLQSNMVHPYIKRRRGWERVTYPHPSLEPVLRETYGILLFQEQILEVAHVFAGLNLSEADKFRSLMSKFHDPTEMESQRERFVSGAIRTHAGTAHPVSRGLANAVFDIVSAFVGYGFCKSHAAAFARTVYQTAYLKAHHPEAQLAAILEHQPGFLPLQTIVEEARLLGISVLPPCVVWSGVTYGLERLGETPKNGESSPSQTSPVEDIAIRVSLCQIDNVSPASAARIVLERGLKPFESLDDMFRRVRLDADVWDNLARSGTLDVFGSRREVLWHLGRLQKLGSKASSQQLAFDDFDLPRDRVLLEMPSIEEEIAWDFATAGITTGLNPLALHRAHLNKLGAVRIEELFERPAGSTVLVAGAVISRQRPPTAAGFTFLILEDETYRIPTALQPHLYDQFERALREPALLVEGILECTPEEKRTGQKGLYRSLLIKRLWSLSDVLRTERLMEGQAAVSQINISQTVHGASGFPGENPRTGAAVTAKRDAKVA